jgi:ABC-type transport system involved in cytochrome bd biosynthesis fused ATPase/permease subunit
MITLKAPAVARTTLLTDGVPQTTYHTVDEKDHIVEVRDLSLWYGATRALTNVSLAFPRNKITALIGPSGCGKSTLLRSINRMNDLIKGVRIEGDIVLDGANVYGRDVDPVEVRRRVGMVFQKPNPFPRSIRENILYGAKINGYQGNHNDLVEWSLQQAALWNEVKDNLNKSGLALSAAAPVHRPRYRPATRRAADGRAGVGIGPYFHVEDRRPDARAGAKLHDHHRDAQHAAGGARFA